MLIYQKTPTNHELVYTFTILVVAMCVQTTRSWVFFGILVRNVLKHAGFHLFFPLQSFWAEIFFYYRELLVSEKFLYNAGFLLWFYSLRRVSGLFWAKSIISLFFKFIHCFKICLINEDCPIASC